MGFSAHYRNPQLRASRNWKCALGCYRQIRIEVTDNATFQEEQTTRSLIAYGMRSRARAYRWDKLRRAFTRTAENNAPAPPTSASTAVGFSGQ
jgi:hypothetical protein